MKTALGYAVLLPQLISTGIGLVLYAVSFSGYGAEDGGGFFVAGFVCAFLGSIPTVIRDVRFFKKHWGLSLLETRTRFPMQVFPARLEKWLNPLAWWFMAIVFLHFFWLIIGATNQAAARDTGDELRLVSSMLIVGGAIGALMWEYPPTEKPQRGDSVY